MRIRTEENEPLWWLVTASAVFWTLLVICIIVCFRVGAAMSLAIASFTGYGTIAFRSWRSKRTRLVDPSHCSRSEYDLRGTRGATCPECGRPIDPQTRALLQRLAPNPANAHDDQD